jgi:hypothetical protein
MVQGTKFKVRGSGFEVQGSRLTIVVANARLESDGSGGEPLWNELNEPR